MNEYKRFFDYVDAMNTKNGKITRAEMIKACTPDINNNNVTDTATYVDSSGISHSYDEHNIGVNNADKWISKLPSSVMDDQEMTWAEYWSYVSNAQ